MAVFDETQVMSNQIQPERYPRPITSTLDTWDQNTQLDYAHAPTMPGQRPSWNIPSIAVTSETVNTIRSSAETRFVSPSIPIRAQLAASPSTKSTSFKVVPNMAQTLYTNSSVQINFAVSVETQATQDVAFFVIFRDGQQISQIYSGGTGLVSGTYIDTNPAMNTTHVYDLRWHSDGSTITATGKERTFQASNLRAQ